MPDGIVGHLADKPLTVGEIVAGDAADFQKLSRDYDREQHRLQLKYTKARYDLLQKRLDKILDERALDEEAKASGTTPEIVLKDFKPDNSVTDVQARAFYDAHKDRLSQPYEQIALQLKVYLAGQHNDAATREFYDALRAKHGISSSLAPYTVDVAAVGPARGRSDAAVTIIEFGDFQCPFCRKAEDSIRSLLERYPQQVRLVFRNLPLTEIHPNAQMAAEAVVCANRQGAFWPMHDALYADQSALGLNGLKATAQRLGLDAEQLTACMAEPATAQAIAADTAAADNLGISGTPFFFINGRPIDGDVPVEQFQEIIDSELHRLGHVTGAPTAKN
jgi:protein-disulfide isomerase